MGTSSSTTEAPLTSTSVVTETVTEIVTELEPVTEIVMVTQIDEVTEEILTPDEEIEDDCVTAALLGLDCTMNEEKKNQPKKAERLNDEIDSQFVLISTSNNEENNNNELEENYLVPDFEVDDTTTIPKESDLSTIGLIQTSPISNLLPDRDDTFESILSNQQPPMMASSTNNAGGMTSSKEKEENLEMVEPKENIEMKQPEENMQKEEKIAME